MKNKLTLSVMKEKLGVCRLKKDSVIPNWANTSTFLSITKTHDEVSIVCPEDCIPNDIQCEKGWRSLKVEGPLDFGLVGILASISSALADAGISIFAISTYDTDYILIKEEELENTIRVLELAGNNIKSI